MSNLIDRIITNTVSNEDLLAAKALYFFLSIPKSYSLQLRPYRYIVKSAYYGTTLFKNDIYHIVPYRPTKLGLIYSNEISEFLEDQLQTTLQLIQQICFRCKIGYEAKLFEEPGQLECTEAGIDWNQGLSTVQRLLPNMEELADFFIQNNFNTFEKLFLPVWNELSTLSQYFAASLLFATFEYVQNLKDQELMEQTNELSIWAEKIKKCPYTPSFCKPFAIHQIDRMILLNRHLKDLVANIN